MKSESCNLSLIWPISSIWAQRSLNPSLNLFPGARSLRRSGSPDPPKCWKMQFFPVFFAFQKMPRNQQVKNMKKMRKSVFSGSQKWWCFALFLKKSILRKLVFRLDGSMISRARTPSKTVKNRWTNYVIFGHRIFRVFFTNLGRFGVPKWAKKQ